MPVVLVGVADMNVAGLRCLVVARSHGRSMGAWWTKMGLWVGLAVPDVAGMVNMVPSGSNVMPEGGGSVGMVVLAGGCDMLTLYITSLVVGVGALWGVAHGPLGSMMLLVACLSPHVPPLSSNSGSWYLHT